jgi:hypothetical protein
LTTSKKGAVGVGGGTCGFYLEKRETIHTQLAGRVHQGVKWESGRQQFGKLLTGMRKQAIQPSTLFGRRQMTSENCFPNSLWILRAMAFEISRKMPLPIHQTKLETPLFPILVKKSQSFYFFISFFFIISNNNFGTD